VAVFGAILTSRLREEMSAMLRAAHIQTHGGISLGSPKAIGRLPAPIPHIVQESFTRAMETVFLVGVPIALAGFIAVLALKELPLRSGRMKTPEVEVELRSG
jgi:hypothetical protein